MSEIIKNRYDFVALVEAIDSNPNGNPDAGNMPRMDQETGHGIITDVCLKRKIRDYVDTVMAGKDGYDIYVKSGVPLNRSDLTPGEKLGITNELKGIQEADSKDAAKKIGTQLKKSDPEIDRKIRDYMCEHFFDVRSFGAVMTTFTKGALNCGQIRGPIQLTFARSIDPIVPQDYTITRVSITRESDAENKETEMGHKYVVPYGLYRFEGFISANLAQKTTGFTEDDLQLFWDAIMNLFENDHAACRGKMSVRKLIIFKHDSELGNAPSYKLFDAVHVERKNPNEPARRFADYDVRVDEAAIPSGVTVEYRD